MFTAKPAGLIVATVGSAVTAVAILVLAGAALSSAHGQFSGGVAIALLVYAAGILGATWAMWRGQVLGRGPVLACALLNLIAGYTFTGDAPWVWAFVAIAAATVVAAAMPSTSRALGFSERGARPPTDEPGN